MINRHRFRLRHDGTHNSTASTGSENQLGTTGPVVGTFIAGPIGALIGRVLAGTIEAVTNIKATTPRPKKKRAAKKSGPAGQLPSKAEGEVAKATSATPPRKRRAKKP
jgi:hypothetical protein